jgi:hypothetical protein
MLAVFVADSPALPAKRGSGAANPDRQYYQGAAGLWWRRLLLSHWQPFENALSEILAPGRGASGYSAGTLTAGAPMAAPGRGAAFSTGNVIT